MEAGPSAALTEAELERLFVRMEKPLYNVIYRWVWSREEARDITQEAFLRLWKMRARVDLTRVEPLLYRIAINLASNRRRAKKLWRWLSLDTIADRPTATDEGAALLDRERDRMIAEAIDGLPEKLRRVVTLAELSGMSYQEIGAALSIPAGTVGSRRNKALELLKEKLEPYVEAEDAVG